MLKGVYCFITASVDCAKAGVTALLKPEPGSDLFVDLLGGALITAMASIFLLFSHLLPTHHLVPTAICAGEPGLKTHTLVSRAHLWNILTCI